MSRMRCDLCRRNVTELRAAGDLPLREFKDRRVFGLSACPGRQTCYLCARCYRVHVPPDQQTREVMERALEYYKSARNRATMQRVGCSGRQH